MRVFFAVWFGQLISIIGSNLTSFALGVWVYERHESATEYALIFLFTSIAQVLVSPFAGALVDRWDRRLVMLISDCGAGASSLAVAILLAGGHLAVWEVYAAVFVSAACGAFQWPAYTAATVLLVPQKHYTRASGMMDIGYGISTLVAPALAGAIMLAAGVQVVLMIDFATFIFSVVTLSLVRFPHPAQTDEAQQHRGSLWSEMRYGWSYVASRRGLLALLGFFAIVNFLTGIMTVLSVPLILSFTSEGRLGTMMSIGAVGGLLGSLAVSVWGGPRRRIVGVLLFGGLVGLGSILIGLRASVWFVTAAMGLAFFCYPIVSACSQSIWMSKVAPDVQGRVASVRSVVVFLSMALASPIGGPAADYVFEPLLAPGGALASSVGRVIGVGPGRGTALIFILMGVLVIVTVIGAWTYPHLRRIDDELPDFQGVNNTLTNASGALAVNGEFSDILSA
jgi:MFS family permease